MAGVEVKLVANPRFNRELDQLVNTLVKETAKELRDEIRSDVGTPFPPASQPGTPPHKRSGALQKSIVTSKIGDGDWAVAVNVVDSPSENDTNRDLVGLWLELGTGVYRQPFPTGSQSVGGGVDTAQTGKGKSSMQPRPFLLNKFLTRGPQIFKAKLSGGGLLGRVKSFFSSLIGR